MTDLIERDTNARAALPAVLTPLEREQLRHPLERVVVRVVAVLDALLVVLVLLMLTLAAEWLEARPTVAKYQTHARLLLLAVIGSPAVATYARRKHGLLAQEEGIRVSATQLPEVHRVLASCEARHRLGTRPGRGCPHAAA